MSSTAAPAQPQSTAPAKEKAPKNLRGRFADAWARMTGTVTEEVTTEEVSEEYWGKDDKGKRVRMNRIRKFVTTDIDQGGPKANFKSTLGMRDGRGIRGASLSPSLGANMSVESESGLTEVADMLSIRRLFAEASGRFRQTQETEGPQVVSRDLRMEGTVKMKASDVTGVGKVSFDAPGMGMDIVLGSKQ